VIDQNGVQGQIVHVVVKAEEKFVATIAPMEAKKLVQKVKAKRVVMIIGVKIVVKDEAKHEAKVGVKVEAVVVAHAMLTVAQSVVQMQRHLHQQLTLLHRSNRWFLAL
jgi:CO dehydrogenase/acetyl-CoA synthase epsilon subunit